MSSDVMDELEKLRAEIAEAAKRDPELRVIHQKTRAAFAVAVSLAAIVDSAKIELESLAKAAKVSLPLLVSALNAAPDSEVPVEAIRRLAQVLRRQFEILMHPSDGPVPSESDSSDGDARRSFVRIRFPMLGPAPRRADPTRQLIESAVRKLVQLTETRLAAQPNEAARELLERLHTAIAAWPSTETPLSFVVGVADAAGYTIRLGFLDMRSLGVYVESTSKVQARFSPLRKLPSDDTESEFRFMSISD